MIISFMKKLFGTDGVRARAGEFPLDGETIKTIAFLLGSYFKETLGREPRFLIGRDTRESGEWIEQNFYSGAIKAGAYCESASIITTPGVAFITSRFGFDAGIVISASHNPFQDNGIKIFSPSGKKLDDEIEKWIEAEIFKGRKIEGEKTIAIKSSVAREYQKAYLEHLAEGFEDLYLKDFKIVIDCANGAASHLAFPLFSRFCPEVVLISCEPNGRNINQNCGSLHIEALQNEVVKAKANLGIAFDGDADRAIFVDEKGNVADGDSVLYVLSDFLLNHGKLANKTVVATVMSNVGLEIALQKKNIKLLRVAVGDKYVLDELLKTNSDLGGEQSGHIIFPFRSLAGDGMLTALFVMRAIQESQMPLSLLTEGFLRYPQILVNVAVREKKPFEELPRVMQVLRGLEQEINGKGRILLRYSGTENLARVMIEGEDEEQIKQQANKLAKVIKEEIG